MLLVVGLGNPGRQYAAHRHNVGFMAVGELAAKVGAEAFRDKFSGSYAKAELERQPAWLLLPMTYMNASGQCVQPAAAFFKAAPADIVVLHDELDLPFGEVRLKFGGGHAGHNGLRSIMAALGTGDFGRIRIGIGRPPAGFRGDVADYVLSGFDASERAELPEVLNRATESVLQVAARGFDAAMKARNTREKPPKNQSKSSDPREPDPRSGG